MALRKGAGSNMWAPAASITAARYGVTAHRPRDVVSAASAADAPVLIVARFTLHPERQHWWLDAWRALARAAEQTPECRSFHLLHDTRHEHQRFLVSSWTSRDAFNRFVRETGLVWMERALDYAHRPTEFLYLEDVLSDDEGAVVATLPTRRPP